MGDEGDKQETTEELFEDLDKFFAPIQDVDWPEEEEERPAGPPTTPTGEGHVDVRPPSEPSEPSEAVEPAPTVVAPIEEAPEEAPRPAEPEEEIEPEPPVVVEEAEEAPSFEEEIEVEAPPSEEAVEEAVEHFADSVREEVEKVEEAEAAEAAEAYRTAEMPAMDVFGEAEEEAPIAGELEGVEEGILAGAVVEAGPKTIKVGAEGLGGPSWQEPSSVEVGAEEERRPGERDVPAAFVTGLVLAILAVGSLLISPAAFAVVASILVLLGQGELYGVLHRRHRQPATAVGLVSGALILAAAYLRGEAAMLSMAALGTIAAFLWYMAVPAAHRKDIAGNVALTLLPVIYGPLLAGYALTTLALERTSDGTPVDGQALILAVIGLTFAYDTAAFAVGYFWGSRPLAPSVSPKKSWEGVIGATLVVIAISVAFVPSWVEPITAARAVGLALVVALFAPLGDLAESLLKRDLGVKDMGSVLPGHGGVMDRIDSVLFVAPAALIFFRLVL